MSQMRVDAVDGVEDVAVPDRVVKGDGNFEWDCRCRWTRCVGADYLMYKRWEV